MQPTRCTRCPRKKCGILVATKIQVTAIDDMFLYAECLFMPICIENIWYQTPLQAHWTSGMMARCYISDAAVEIFSNLLHRCDFFLHFCDLFLVTPATEAQPACISFNSLMPKIRSPDGSEFLSFQYQRHFWNSSFLSGNLRNASVCLDLWEHGLQYNRLVARCRYILLRPLPSISLAD